VQVSDLAAPPVGLDVSADLDLRLVRYFTVVAEYSNFGRAAAALHVAQPALSRQIQRLESQLGVRLFERTPQGSHLTAAGRAFLPQARALVYDARRAATMARAAAPTQAITIGFVEDLVVTPAVRELGRRRPGAQIGTRHLNWTDARDALIEHRVDAVIARMPFPYARDGLAVTVLYEEPRVLVVPIFHRLATTLPTMSWFPVRSPRLLTGRRSGGSSHERAASQHLSVRSLPTASRTSLNSSQTDKQSPFSPPVTGASPCAMTSRRFRSRASTHARS
jgi:DNA-binding transcriptional LysR family regulator